MDSLNVVNLNRTLSIRSGLTGSNLVILGREMTFGGRESLLDSPNSVVWVTERLYILLDWNRLGNLMATSQYIRLIFLEMRILDD